MTAYLRISISAIVLEIILTGLLPGLAAPGDEFWDDRFDALGIDGDVWAIAAMGSDVYVGGQFTKAGNAEALNIARWDGTNWWPLGAGVDGLGVRALAVIGTNIYAGGFFTRAGQAQADSLAKWDGLKWSDLAGGVGGSVMALAARGTTLYVGGQFAGAGGVIASNVVTWDGIGWSPLGEGVSYLVRGIGGNYADDASVRALIVQGDILYVAGRFNKAGGSNATNIAKWDGFDWRTLGTGTGDLGTVETLATVGPYLYVGGTFYPLRTMAPTNITRWDGTNWSYLGDGLVPRQGVVTPYVRSFAVMGDDLFVGGGGFQKMGSTNIARWNGFAWEGLGRGLSAGGDVNALAVKGSQLYVGGQFTAAGGKPSRRFAIWHIPEKLRIRRNQNAVELSWPLSLSNFVLEASAQLPGANWTELRKSPTLQNERLSVTDEATAPQQFYRLRKKP